MTPTTPTDFLYFAYGSNLLSRRLLARTPSATALGVGALKGHELRWHMASTDGSGKCDVVPSAHDTAQVYGVVYRIQHVDKPVLDAAESLGVGYQEQLVTVHMPTGPLQAWLYVALRRDPAVVPYDWYHALVLSGAQEHGLPPGYIQTLHNVPTQPDADADRAQRHFSLTRPDQR